MVKSKYPKFPRCWYSLSRVKQCLENGEVILRPNARRCAVIDFGWGTEEIIRVISMLKPIHFYKSDYSNSLSGVILDVYKGHFIGEDVYIHFYVDDDDKLVINSFKKDLSIG
jgi:hypothetical protein